MQKKVLRRTILLFLLSGIVFACMEEYSLSPEATEARVWYMNHTDGVYLKVLGNNEIVLLAPDWKKSFSNQDANYKIIEVDMESEKKLGFTSPEAMKKFEETKDKNYLESHIRLIVRTNKKTKETDGFIMVVYPELSYLNAHKGHALKNISYLERGDDFSGSIYYYDINGNFVNGWQYVDGTAYVFYLDVKNTESELRGQICYDIFETTYHYTDWYINEKYQETVYNGSTTEYIGTYCYETGGGGYDNGGYGGGSGNGGNNLPNTIELRKDCPSSAATNGTTINNVLAYSSDIKNKINTLTEYANTKETEYGLAIQQEGSQFKIFEYKGQIFVPGTQTHTDILYTDDTYMIAHSHPFGISSTPSMQDAFTLTEMYRERFKKYGENSKIRANVVIGSDGGQYMVYVTDRTAFISFSKNDNYFDTGHKFNQSLWSSEFTEVMNSIMQSGFSHNDAKSYALTYILDKYNTGMKIYKKNDSNLFKEQKTESTTSGSTINYSLKICP